MTTTDMVSHSRCLVDTNILLRLAQTAEKFPREHHAVERLRFAGNRLYMTFQNIAEFWNVSTRMLSQNGRGLLPSQAHQQVQLLERQFEVITEDRETYERWLQLVVDFKVAGRQVHDAPFVAHMLVRGIPALLTSNIKDFTRYTQIQLLDPEQVA